MSIIVKGMKMPENCIKCPLQFGGWCYESPPEIDERIAPTVDEALEQGKPDWCPLIALPDHHGRLVDADALRDRLRSLADDGWNKSTTTSWAEAFSECAYMVDEQPTIEPQRKKGMWIEHNPHKWGLGIVFECSECGEKIDCEPSNFCPNCGADMREDGADDKT